MKEYGREQKAAEFQPPVLRPDQRDSGDADGRCTLFEASPRPLPTKDHD
jgi:hypothetical protein